MGPAPGLRGDEGRWARRRGRPYEALGEVVSWAEREQLGVRAPRWPAYPPHPNPLPDGEGPATLTPSHREPEEASLEPRVAACYEKLRALPRRARRALQRHFALPLAELALLLALWQGPAWAATITVDGTTCTLAAAITAANTDAVSGGCAAGSGTDTLELPAGGTLTLTAVDNTTYSYLGLPVVSSAITIAGQSSTLERSGSAPEFGLLAVGIGGDLTVRELTLRGGASASGGGVFNFGGTLTLEHSTLSGNFAVSGGGVTNYNGSLTIVHSTLSGNSAHYVGGGVANSGSLTLTDSTITGNSASDGGGAYNTGTLTLVHSTLSGNTADCGGGAYNTGTLALINSTVSGNAASCSGGGVGNRYGTVTLTNSTLSGNTAFISGGGVFNIYGTVTIANSTLSDNAAIYDGGGVFNLGSLTLANSTLANNSASNGGGVSHLGSLTLTNSTLSGNTAIYDGGGVYLGSLTLARTLVSGNTASTGAEIFSSEEGSVTVDDFNLFGQDGTSGVSGFTPGATDITPQAGVILSDILDPILAFNGGPTQTHILVSGSPAVDAVAAGICPPADQCGFVRPVDGDAVNGPACDIGAVELGASPPPVVNSRVSFVALPATFSTTTDTTGCPSGFAGKFFFQAALTNLDGSLPLAALKDQVVELGNGNQVQTADGGPAGAGSLQTLPEVGDFSDGVLEATGTLQVPFTICLQTLNPFRFTVDALGIELSR